MPPLGHRQQQRHPLPSTDGSACKRGMKRRDKANTCLLSEAFVGILVPMALDRLTHLNSWCSSLVEEFHDCRLRGGYHWQEVAVISDLAKVFTADVVAAKLEIPTDEVESALAYRRSQVALGLAS